MTLTVLSNECPKGPDGRVQHYFRRDQAGRYVCQDCPEVRQHPFVEQRRKEVG